MLGATRTLNRLECVTQTLRHALNELAASAPRWLRTQTTSEWVKRYGLRASDYRFPKGEPARLRWAPQVGRDGQALLEAVYSAAAPTAIRDLAAVQILRQVWIQNFLVSAGDLQWRGNDDTPPAGKYISSPYDLSLIHI